MRCCERFTSGRSSISESVITWTGAPQTETDFNMKNHLVSQRVTDQLCTEQTRTDPEGRAADPHLCFYFQKSPVL
ncbi:hypothetical protein ROHU_027919 [Labeo rohita]|uniref:Uncharacterized protein n=1 Tax=Labeo rohita TaxID=84645 RepID=A0A498MFH5_LABRO|nr:hypothetical protein ROHU_027919 [Labeo rohita]